MAGTGDIKDYLLAAVITAAIGLVVLYLTWPGDRAGAKLLARWGAEDPTPSEVASAVTYLKRRRLWYPVVLIAFSVLAPWTVARGVRPDGTSQVLAVLLGGALLAELCAQRPQRNGLRAALLVPRRLTDLVSWWSIGLAVVLLAFDIAHAALVLAGHVGPHTPADAGGSALTTAVAVTAAGAATCWLAVRRPVAGETRIDQALRVRSARVGLGLTIGALGLVSSAFGDDSLQFAGFLLALVGLAGWYHTARWSRLPRPTTARS